MADHNDTRKLHDKLDALLKRQQEFLQEIYQLRIEINRLKSTEQAQGTIRKEAKQDAGSTQSAPEIKQETIPQRQQAVPAAQKPKPQRKSDLEKFIGENLINKIGIIITIIGVAVGAKYAIDHELISPLTRIILGYLVGAGLLGFALKLKKKYGNFSAVLLSGAMAILYFITYAAYDFYQLIPQVSTFLLMVVFTVFTVVSAIGYNKQVIAHIGLVGAYAVPFLLSDGSGRVAVLFSYMAIINIGILAIAFKKYWKPLYYVSFGLTWLIYALWYVSKYQVHEDWGMALIVLTVFFVTFYLILLAYKLLHKELFQVDDIILLLANSFVFYGMGYAVFGSHPTGAQLLGVFTLCNAVLHAIVSMVLYRQGLPDKNLFYLVTGLALVYITIAVPVQLDGSWATLLWAGEAALLFGMGRVRHISFYEKLSYPLMVLAFGSIIQDWTIAYTGYSSENPETGIRPLLNIHFLSSVLFIVAFGYINFLNRSKQHAPASELPKGVSKVMSFFIPAVLLCALYYAFRLEIANYWHQQFEDSALIINSGHTQHPKYYWNYDLNRYKIIWMHNYTLLFVAVLAFANIRKIRSVQLGWVSLGLIVVTLLVYLTQGLYVLSELRESYLKQTLAQYYPRTGLHIGIRYLSFIFVVLVLVACYQSIRQDYVKKNFKTFFHLLLHITIVWIASSELINWMDIARSVQSYKLGLSILWGVYALFLIILGIWQHNKPLRIGAIVLFGITLIKLFFYDIAHLNTIAKTIVLVSLGVLLLIISFLYNKYKHVISDEPEH